MGKSLEVTGEFPIFAVGTNYQQFMEVFVIITFIVVVSIMVYFDHMRSVRYREKMEEEAMMHDQERAKEIARMNTLIFVNEVKHQAALVGDQATI